MIAYALLASLLQAGPVDLLIKNGTVVTVDPEMRVLEGGAVAIRGSVIASLYPRGEALPAARETIDATGNLVIPGLVNTHGHVPMILLRGIADDLKLMEWLNQVIFPAEAKTVSPDFSYWGTLLGCIEMAKSGTTTFTDMYYFEDDMARAVDRAGLRAVLGQTIIGFPAPDYKTTDAALAASETFIKKWKDHARVIPSIAPHALYTTDMGVVKKAREISIRYGVPFQIHAHESPQEDEAVRAKLGKTTITALDEAGILGRGVILHHVITVTPADIQIMVQRGVGASHNPESNMKGASGLAPAPDLLKAGVALGLGTDGPASNNNLDLFEEMDTVAKVHKLVRSDPTVMPARDVFRMATLGGAQALGLSDRIGSLEVGKKADLVLVDVSRPEFQPIYDVYSHLVYTLKGGAVRTVVVDGRVVLKDRRMTTLDEAEVTTKVLELKSRILKSLGKESQE